MKRARVSDPLQSFIKRYTRDHAPTMALRVDKSLTVQEIQKVLIGHVVSGRYLHYSGEMFVVLSTM